jgi:hypothetical protein
MVILNFIVLEQCRQDFWAHISSRHCILVGEFFLLSNLIFEWQAAWEIISCENSDTSGSGRIWLQPFPSHVFKCRHSTDREIAIMTLMAYLSYLLAEVWPSSAMPLSLLFFSLSIVGEELHIKVPWSAVDHCELSIMSMMSLVLTWIIHVCSSVTWVAFSQCSFVA